MVALCIVLVAILLIGCAKPPEPPAVTPVPEPAPPAETPVATPDEEPPAETITHVILTTDTLGVNEYSKDGAGFSQILPRDYPDAPPQVPHDITEYVITRAVNACLDCHISGASLGESHIATKIPESHYTDITTGVVSEYMNDLRYNCLICHLPKSADAPLVK